MRELVSEEIDQVSGGRLDWGAGAGMIFSISSFSPATMAFGYPIAGAMLYMEYQIP